MFSPSFFEIAYALSKKIVFCILIESNQNLPFMNSRRKFLLQGSMATTALVAFKPFKTIADTLSPLTGFSINDNKLVFLFTGNYQSNSGYNIPQLITSFKNNTGNLLVLHAGEKKDSTYPQLQYDATLQTPDMLTEQGNNYTILNKGNFKIGIISVTPVGSDTINTVNNLSDRLKHTNNCDVVICLSQLGYQNANTDDDIKLAAASSNIDIIIGGHPDNFFRKPCTIKNKETIEVFIHSAGATRFLLGNIEIAFDGRKNKKSISFNSLINPELSVS